LVLSINIPVNPHAILLDDTDKSKGNPGSVIANIFLFYIINSTGLNIFGS
jgi:hypothetical protein